MLTFNMFSKKKIESMYFSLRIYYIQFVTKSLEVENQSIFNVPKGDIKWFRR